MINYLKFETTTRRERRKGWGMYQSVIHAFMTGLVIGVSTVCAFQLGTAIAKYLSRTRDKGDQ